jgi:hypothetical protein
MLVMVTLLLLAVVVLGMTLVIVPIALLAALVQRLRGRTPRTPLLIALICGVTFIVLSVGLALASTVGGNEGPAGVLQYMLPGT